LKRELRAFERLSQSEVIALARAEVEPLQVLGQEVDVLKRELRSFERLTQSEVIALARAEVEPLQSVVRELRALETYTQREAVEPLKFLASELRSFERVSQAEVIALARAEIEPLQSLTRELRALETITQKDAIEPVQTLTRELRSFERLTQSEVIALARAETEPVRALLQEVAALKSEVRGLDRSRNAVGSTDVEELRRVVSDLAEVSRLQGEQIESLSGGDLVPAPNQQVVLKNDLDTMRRLEAFEHQTEPPRLSSPPQSGSFLGRLLG